MNKLFLIGLLVASVSLNVYADPGATNDTEHAVIGLQSEHAQAQADDKDWGHYEITLGGAGVVVPKTGSSQFGLDFSLATDPLKFAPNVWFGWNQELTWEPNFAGSSDLYSEYAWNLYKNLWMNTGWSVGILYDKETSPLYRTGPQVEFEFYVGDHSFFYTTVNYDFNSDTSRVQNGIRYSFGIGFTF